jgi:hypothetical protein
MAVKPEEGSIPLYIHTVTRILREMRMSQQVTGARFDYESFRSEVLTTDLTSAQLAPLNQRLSTLESFMPRPGSKVKSKKRQIFSGTSWENQVIMLIEQRTHRSMTDKRSARLTDDCRPLLPMHLAGNSLFIVQQLLEFVPRARHDLRSSLSSG